MPRGGKRQGQVGKAYSNRHDLNPVQAPKAPTGQTYGAAGQQVAAQQAIPLPGAGAGPVAPGPPPGGAPSGAPAPPTGPAPGELPSLHAPTDRPNEPLTNGIASGPGAGPEALAPPDPLVKGAAFLNSLGKAADPATQRLRDMVNAAVGNQAAV